jgi:spore coat polysaccharide biosynthesis protein SpsF
VEPNIAVIVQARMGASRLPGKMLLPLHGSPIVEWVFRRVQKAELINNILFAIPKTPDNDTLNAFLEKMGARVYRGSEEDVIERFYFAAKNVNATHIVRVCADNPFIAGAEIDQLVQFYFKSSCDYAYNHIPKNNCYPDGIGAEIVSLQILKSINDQAKDPRQREHIFNFIWDNPGKFEILTFDPVDERLAHPDIQLDIDTQRDYEKLCKMKVDIEMEAFEIVAAAKALK